MNYHRGTLWVLARKLYLDSALMAASLKDQDIAGNLSRTG